MNAEIELPFFVRAALPADLPAVESLRRADSANLGFVPSAKYEHIVHRTSDRGRARWRYESLYVVEDQKEITGFCLANFSRDGSKIEQICVRKDARRLERALCLEGVVAAEAKRRWSPRIRCRVAYDIDANFFWRAAGYEAIATTTSTWMNLRESQSKRPLVIYEKLFAVPLFSRPVAILEHEH